MWLHTVWQSGDIQPWRERLFLYCVKPNPTRPVSTSGSTTTPRSTPGHSSPSPRSFACTLATMPAWRRIPTSTPAPKKPSAWLFTVSVKPLTLGDALSPPLWTSHLSHNLRSSFLVLQMGKSVNNCDVIKSLDIYSTKRREYTVNPGS